MHDSDIKELFSAIKMLKDKLDEHLTRIESFERQILTRIELLESQIQHSKTQKKGDGRKRKGIVRAIIKDFIIVDVGLKSDGVISASEFTPEELANLKVNDEIEVVVENWDGDRGMVLSRA